MTFPLIALALVLAGTDASATTLLQPGLYRLQPEAYLAAASVDAVPGSAAGEVIDVRYEHAVPAAAKARYAFVARDLQARRNTLVFLTDPAYQYDINSANRLCPAYAFPGWNDRSAAQPYCRTNIGTDGSEVALAWTSTRLTLRWQDHKRLLRTENIPAQRPPTAEEAGTCAITDVCPAQAYGRSVHHYQVTRRSDVFVLQQARDYVDVLYLPVATTLLPQPQAGSTGEAVAAGTYLAVLGRNAGWYQVERIAPDGSSTRGWIDRDTLSQPHWVVQRAHTDRFRFALGLEPDDADPGRALLTAIEVRDAVGGQRVQILRDLGGEADVPDGDTLQLLDANGDGHPDLLVPGTDTFLLFDPATGMFADATLTIRIPPRWQHAARPALPPPRRLPWIRVPR